MRAHQLHVPAHSRKPPRLTHTQTHKDKPSDDSWVLQNQRLVWESGRRVKWGWLGFFRPCHCCSPCRPRSIRAVWTLLRRWSHPEWLRRLSQWPLCLFGWHFTVPRHSELNSSSYPPTVCLSAFFLHSSWRRSAISEEVGDMSGVWCRALCLSSDIFIDVVQGTQSDIPQK